MWRNGAYYEYYQPGLPESIGGGVGKWLGVLFIFSPYLFLPYLLYRSIDQKHEPFLWTASIVIIGAFLVYYLAKFIILRLIKWKTTGGFPATASLYLFLLGFMVLQIWSVQAGFARLLIHFREGLLISQIFAVVFALSHLFAYLNRKLGFTK
jgi:hypothetical protein